MSKQQLERLKQLNPSQYYDEIFWQWIMEG